MQLPLAEVVFSVCMHAWIHLFHWKKNPDKLQQVNMEFWIWTFLSFHLAEIPLTYSIQDLPFLRKTSGRSVRNFLYALFTTRVFSSNVAVFQSCFMFALKTLDPVLFRAKYIPVATEGGGDRSRSSYEHPPPPLKPN